MTISSRYGHGDPFVRLPIGINRSREEGVSNRTRILVFEMDGLVLSGLISPRRRASLCRLWSKSFIYQE